MEVNVIARARISNGLLALTVLFLSLVALPILQYAITGCGKICRRRLRTRMDIDQMHSVSRAYRAMPLFNCQFVKRFRKFAAEQFCYLGLGTLWIVTLKHK